MSQISHIKYKDVIEAWRFDAEYFKPNLLEMISNLEKKWCFVLWENAEIKWWKRLPIGENFSGEWIPYIRAEDIKNWFVDYENSPKISEELHNKLINYQTKKDDVLISIVWSVWDVGIVKFELDKCNLTENACKVINLRWINSDGLFIFMLSEYGQNQIHREKVWTNQPKLALERVRRFKIPKFTDNIQQEISKIVQTSYDKKQQSKQLYQEAEKLLLTELWLKNHTISHTLTFSTTKKAVDEAWRYDADYFQPKYDELIEKIESYKWGWDYVENIFKHKKWYEPWAEAYSQDWKDFIRVSDFTKFWIDWTDKKISDKLYDELKWDYQAKKWEILFTKDWTIWITYVLKEDLEWIISSAFLRLNLKEKYENYEKECLALILNSIICKLQIERFSWWALISHLKPSDFERIKIPLINPELQKEISDKIKESFKLRNESKELLEQAKKMVEDEIEKK